MKRGNEIYWHGLARRSLVFGPAILSLARIIHQRHPGDQDGIAVGLPRGLGVGASCQIKNRGHAVG